MSAAGKDKPGGKDRSGRGGISGPESSSRGFFGVSVLQKAAKVATGGKPTGFGGLGSLSSILPIVSGFLPPGVGGAVNALTGLISGAGGGKGKGSSPQAGGLPAIIGPIISRVLPSTVPSLPRIVGPTAGGVVGGLVGNLLGGGGGAVTGACPSGYHLAKDGSGRCVRNRRMNSLNPRAFRRAVRRLKGARRFAREVEKVFPRPRRAPARSTRHITGPQHT